MDYNKILGYIIAFIFAWLFVALNANIEFTRPQKRPLFYRVAVYVNMIMSFTGLVLCVRSPQLATSFAPYVLATCALVYSSLTNYYVYMVKAENPDGWEAVKFKVYRVTAISLFIVLALFFIMGVKNEYNYAIETKKTSAAIDTLRKEVIQNRQITVKGFNAQSAKADTVKQDLKKELEHVKKNQAEDDKAEKSQNKKLNNLQKKTSATKKDTEVILDKVDDEKKVEERRKFLGIF